MSAVDNQKKGKLITFKCKDGKEIQHDATNTSNGFIDSLNANGDEKSDIELRFNSDIVIAVLEYIMIGIMFPPSVTFEGLMNLNEALHYFCVEKMPDIHTEWDDIESNTYCTFVRCGNYCNNYNIHSPITNCGFFDVQIGAEPIDSVNVIEKTKCIFRECTFTYNYARNSCVVKYAFCVFENCKFSIPIINMRNCKFVNCVFNKIFLHLLTECEFNKCNFNSCEYGTLSGIVFNKCRLQKFSQIRECDLNWLPVIYNRKSLSMCNIGFNDCDLSYSILVIESGKETRCILTNVKFVTTSDNFKSLSKHLYRSITYTKI